MLAPHTSMTNQSRSTAVRSRKTGAEVQRSQAVLSSQARATDRNPAREFLICVAWLRLFKAIVSRPCLLPERQACSHEI